MSPAEPVTARTTSGAAEPLLQRLQAFTGRTLGSADVARDEVNLAMIRHWCDAIGDDNPVYTDPVAAAASVHAGLVAPPTMVQAWGMRGLRPPPRERNAQDDLLAMLDGAGFTSVVATNCEQHYERYLTPGDIVSSTAVIESVSPEKQTGLGTGHFVTTRIEFRDAADELVCSMLWRLLKFRPRPGATERPLRPRPAITQDSAFWFEGTRAGRLLIQRCASCGRLRHPPGPCCPACRSFEWDTAEASGRGTLHSVVTVHHPQVAAFDYPLVVGLVELAEGPRLVADLAGVGPGEARIGMALRAELVAVDAELTLPVFHPVREPS